MALLNWLNSKKQSKQRAVGIEAGGRGVAFAHLKTSSGPELLNCELLTAPDTTSTISKLRESIASLELQGAPCNAVLAPEDYSLLLAEAPKIPEEELRDAMRWKIKDLSPIPVDQAVVDVFPMPTDAGSVGKGMIFTVVARKKAVEFMVSLIESVGLTTNAIDIPEFSLLNIARLKANPGQSLLICRLMPEGSQVTAISKGNIYLSRNFGFKYSGGAILPDQADNLALELQRSADYLRHQMHQPSPGKILLLGDGLKDSDLPDSFDDNFSGEARTLNINNGLAVPAGIGQPTLTKCAVAIGAALRDCKTSHGGDKE